MKNNSLIGCALFASVLLPSTYGNLFSNPSFESGGFIPNGDNTMEVPVGSPAIADWSVVNDTLAWIGPANPFGISASDGGYFLDLTNYQFGAPFSGVSQSIPTVPGASYLVTFDLGSSNLPGGGGLAGLQVSANGSVIGGLSVSGTSVPSAWTPGSASFVATGASTLIQFIGTEGHHYIGLDNVSVVRQGTTVPEGGSTALMALTALGSLLCVRRQGR